MRISDWSSDVCSSDLGDISSGFSALMPFIPMASAILAKSGFFKWVPKGGRPATFISMATKPSELLLKITILTGRSYCDMVRMSPIIDRKRVVKGKSVSVRVDLGGRRVIKKKQMK